MGAVAIAVLWAGYAIGMWGYCTIRGYCITPADVVDPRLPSRAVHWTGSEVPPATQAAVTPAAPAPGTGGTSDTTGPGGPGTGPGGNANPAPPPPGGTITLL